MTTSGTPADPREERFRPLSNLLGVAVAAVAATATLALLPVEGLASAAGLGMLVLLVCTPLARVLWLVVRWARRGDRRYALVGVVVLAVPLVALVLSR